MAQTPTNKKINKQATIQNIMDWGSRSIGHNIDIAKFKAKMLEPNWEETLLEIAKGCGVEIVYEEEKEKTFMRLYWKNGKITDHHENAVEVEQIGPPLIIETEEEDNISIILSTATTPIRKPLKMIIEIFGSSDKSYKKVDAYILGGGYYNKNKNCYCYPVMFYKITKN